MINSRNDIVSLLKEYIVTQQEYVYQFWMPEAHEWNVKKQVAYYNGIVLGKFREKDAFTLQVLKEGVTDQALYDEIKINLERHIKMIEGLEQPDIMNKMQMESYKRQRDELSRDTIDDWISNYCRWIQDVAYYWLHKALHIKRDEFIETYIIECHNDFDTFYEKYHSIIEKIDVENLEIVAFQVTSNSNDCADIKKYGLRNLQWVLSNDTELNRFLDENHIRFDIEKKLMHIDDISYDVDFEKYRNLDVISKRGEQLYRIGHKLYYDFQINAFLVCKDIYDYSTIHETPEFFYTLSSLNEVTKGIDKKWKKICKSYVVKFTSKLKDFAYFTFYENEREYMDDKQNNWSALRRLLTSKAVESAFGDSASQIFAYMKPDTVIAPENIIEYVPAEKWRKDVLKYFGKE